MQASHISTTFLNVGEVSNKELDFAAIQPASKFQSDFDDARSIRSIEALFVRTSNCVLMISACFLTVICTVVRGSLLNIHCRILAVN